MRAVRIAILIGLMLAPAASVAGANLPAVGAALDKAYAGRVLMLQSFHAGSTLRYSSTGAFLKGGKPGSWTLDACIRVREVKLESKRLLIKGTRLEYAYSEQENKLTPRPGSAVRVEILTDPGTVNFAGLQQAIANVFVSGNKKFADYVPDYWREYLLHPELLRPGVSRQELAGLMGIEEVDQSDAGAMLPPKLPASTQPRYTAEARRAGLQGSVVFGILVGGDGRIRKEMLIRPLGLGLDEEAAAVLRTWKLKPATQNGKPVAAVSMVEIVFQFY